LKQVFPHPIDTNGGLRSAVFLWCDRQGAPPTFARQGAPLTFAWQGARPDQRVLSVIGVHWLPLKGFGLFQL
jgi:hypothetical protein